MPIPDYQTIMLPLLKLLEDGATHTLSDISDKLADRFSLTEQEINQRFPSSGQKTFHNRVQWARACLYKAGLLDTPKLATYKITDEGIRVLNQNPGSIDLKFLEQYEAFRVFRGTKKEKKKQESEPPIESELTPDEMLGKAYREIRDKLAEDLLAEIKSCNPYFFERLVIDLLVSMGYGEYTPENSNGSAKITPKTNDAGIDGIIPQDKLGLDSVYVQAKKWGENSVSRPDIQKFVGALEGANANKGIFITTTTFSTGAKDFVKSIKKRVILIDGVRLAELMIDNNLGVTLAKSYLIKKIDTDYFADE